MSVIVFFAFFFVLALIAAGLVLLGSWILSLGIDWLLGTGLVAGMALALGALGVAAVLFHAAFSHYSRWPFGAIRPSFDDEEAGEDGDGTDGDGDGGFDGDKSEEGRRGPGGWMTSCPCGSGRPFAHCCGKRAFRKRSR